MLAIGIEMWGSEEFPRAWKIMAAAFLCLGFTAIFKLASGAFPASLRRITWASDGTWLLRDGHGREWAAALGRSSRHCGPVTILVWSAGLRRWWVVLTPLSVDASQYRRLSVRWRLQRHA